MNARGRAVLPLLARTLVPNPKMPVEDGCTMTFIPTYRFNGRDVRLTDVYGELIPQVCTS